MRKHRGMYEYAIIYIEICKNISKQRKLLFWSKKCLTFIMFCYPSFVCPLLWMSSPNGGNSEFKALSVCLSVVVAVVVAEVDL